MRRLKHLSKALSRKQEGSATWHKARRRIAKLHEKIRNQRQDFLHRLSYHWTHENQVIRLETLNVRGMLQNRRLAQAISSVAWSELKRQLRYKGAWYGCHIEEIPMFYPSSQLCNHCGYRYRDLSLSEREWQCPDCGTYHDRDINAARNIRDYRNPPTAGAVGS
jgi:putative transposase